MIPYYALGKSSWSFNKNLCKKKNVGRNKSRLRLKFITNPSPRTPEINRELFTTNYINQQNHHLENRVYLFSSQGISNFPSQYETIIFSWVT